MPDSIVDKEEKDVSNHHEKRPPSEVNYDLEGGDEALHLVGAQRMTEYTEEFNLKLRRKLVSGSNHSQSLLNFTLPQDLLIPPICAAVYFTQFLDKTSLNYARYAKNTIASTHFLFWFLFFFFFKIQCNGPSHYWPKLQSCLTCLLCW